MAKASLLMTAVDKISPATATATQSQEQLSEQLAATRKEASETNKLLSKVDSYDKVHGAVLKAEAAHKRYSKQLDAQRKAIANVKEPTADQIDKISILEQRVTDSSVALRDKSKRLGNLETALRSASIDTARLADAQEDLQRKSSKYTSEIKKQSAELRTLSKSQSDVSESKIDYDKGIAAGGAIVTGSVLAGAMNQSSYTEVREVANWNPDDHKANNDWSVKANATGEMGSASLSDIHKAQALAIRGGADGVKESQKAAQNIVRMAQSLNVEVSEAGEKYNRIKKAFNFTDDQAKAYLAQAAQSSKGLSKERQFDIIDESIQVSGKHKAAGMDINVITAMNAALASTGLESSAASAITENFSERVSFGAGEEQSKDTLKAYSMIGMDAATIKDQASSDSKGFALEILSRIQKTKESGGDSDYLLAHIFGSDGAEVAGNIPALMDALKKQGNMTDAQALSASDLTLKARQDNLGAQSELMFNSFSRLAVIIGEPLLQPLTSFVNGVSSGANELSDWIQNTKGAAEVIAGLSVAGTGALVAMKAHSAFKGVQAIKAGVVNVQGRTSASSTKNSGSTASKISKGSRAAGLAGGLKGAAKLGLRAIPLLGTALLAFDAVNMVTEAITGKGVIDNVKGVFTDEKGSSAFNASIPENKTSIPTPQQFDDKAQSVRNSEQTNTINLNITAKTDGLSIDGEEKLIEAVREKVNIEQFREGY